MSDEDRAAFGIYPRQRATPSSPETRDAASRVIPQFLIDTLVPHDAVDVGLMMVPSGGALRKVGAALIAGGVSPEAVAGMPKHVLAKLAALREQFAARAALMDAQRAAQANQYTRDIQPLVQPTEAEVMAEIIRQRRAAAPEQKMLQGVYRGYAGEPTEEAVTFATPQKRVADYYAQKRAAQTGGEPHVEMLLTDPFEVEMYGHSIPGSGAVEPMATRARKLKPQDIKERTQLYARGGLTKLKERARARP